MSREVRRVVLLNGLVYAKNTQVGKSDVVVESIHLANGVLEVRTRNGDGNTMEPFRVDLADVLNVRFTRDHTESVFGSAVLLPYGVSAIRMKGNGWEFRPTGVLSVDLLLSQIALASNFQPDSRNWTFQDRPGVMYVDNIQQAANKVAEELDERDRQVCDALDIADKVRDLDVSGGQ